MIKKNIILFILLSFFISTANANIFEFITGKVTAQECLGPYHVFTQDERCAWSCGFGTTPAEPNNIKGECICKEGYFPNGNDNYGRLTCIEENKNYDFDCYDSDNGRNIYKKGFSKGYFYNSIYEEAEDFCTNGVSDYITNEGPVLKEFLCKEYGSRQILYYSTVVCEYGCNDGACNEEEINRTKYQCVDSDDFDYNLKGNVKVFDNLGNELSYHEDYCVGDKVVENFCQNGEVHGSKLEFCENGCNDGKCVTESNNKIINCEEEYGQGFVCYSDEELKKANVYPSFRTVNGCSIQDTNEEYCAPSLEIEYPLCSSTDGKDIYTKGRGLSRKIIINNDLKETRNLLYDNCESEKYLLENYCLGSNLIIQKYFCENGCEKGACKKEKTEENFCRLDCTVKNQILNKSCNDQNGCIFPVNSEINCDGLELNKIYINNELKCSGNTIYKEYKCKQESDGKITPTVLAIESCSNSCVEGKCIISMVVNDTVVVNDTSIIPPVVINDTVVNDTSIITPVVVNNTIIIPPKDEVKCVDTDNGIEAYIPGEVIWMNQQTFPDKCLGNNMLQEHFCKDNNKYVNVIKCDEDCLDGACIVKLKSEEEIDNEINQLENFGEKSSCLGCLIGSRCFIGGYRTNLKYCDFETGEFIKQNKEGECNFDYECESNICTYNSCQDLKSQIDENKNLIEKVLETLKKLIPFIGNNNEESTKNRGVEKNIDNSNSNNQGGLQKEINIKK